MPSWLLPSYLRVALVAAVAVVIGSSAPWAHGRIVLPAGGKADEGTYTLFLALIASGFIIYRMARYEATWRVLIVPFLAYLFAAAFPVWDWVRIAGIPPDSNEEFFGLYEEIRVTWGLYLTLAGCLLGCGATFLELRRERRSPPSLLD